MDDVCKELKLDGNANAKETIAVRIIELARCGERSPTKLRDRVLREANEAKALQPRPVMMESEMPTERGQYSFRVKDGAAPDVFSIAAEPAGEFRGVDGFGGDLGFDLYPNTTHEKAREIAKYLNEHIAAITLTY